MVATVRVGPPLSRSGVTLDALVLSGGDAGERYLDGDIEPPPLAVVRTNGAEGGTITQAAGETSWAAAPLPGPWVDAHGAGDSFAGGLTAGLGQGMSIEDAVGLAARCGAACATGRGPYERQLTA